jgi:hypothetical protein
LPAQLVAVLLKQEVTASDVGPRIEHAQQVLDLCIAARLETCAEGMVAAHTPIESVRAQLLEATASTGPELVTTLPAAGAAYKQAADRLDPTSIYTKRGN